MSNSIPSIAKRWFPIRMIIMKSLTLLLIGFLLLFSIAAQISDGFVLWLHPETVSIWDERMWLRWFQYCVTIYFFFYTSRCPKRDGFFKFALPLIHCWFYTIFIVNTFGMLGVGGYFRSKFSTPSTQNACTTIWWYRPGFQISKTLIVEKISSSTSSEFHSCG